MEYMIIELVKQQTINTLNLRFPTLHLSRSLLKEIPVLDFIDEDEFNEAKKTMESNKEVQYECNKY